MNLQDIFDNLQHGELSQLNIGGAGQGVIDPTNYNSILVHVNAALMALHTRFFLREGRDQVSLLPFTTEYELPEDVIKVEAVYSPVPGPNGRLFEFPLNNETNPYSVMTPSARVIRVPAVLVSDKTQDLPEVLKTNSLDIVYRAAPPRLSFGDGHFDPKLIEVPLPFTHLMALCYFVASRVHNPIGLQNEFHMGNSYAMKYEVECQMLEAQGMRIDRDNETTRFERNGWI